MQTRFDAYTATTRAAGPDELLPLIWTLSDNIRRGKGHHGFSDRAAVIAACGTEVGAVQWGGTHGDLVMLEAKGERTPEVVDKLRESFEHRCTRVDSCHDVEEVGAFDRLLSDCIGVKKEYRLKGSKAGDWEDYPEDGRTLYLGSQKSPVRLRLYEKGLSPQYRHMERPDWVRIEVQVRPTKEAKAAYSTADSLAVWGASAWTRELAGKVLAAELQPLPAGTVYKLTERDRALMFMCKQYGAHMIDLRSEVGSWEEVGLHLSTIIRNEQRRRR